MDRAREKTDRQLKLMERNIGRVYKLHPALVKVKKEYVEYMSMVERKTKASYRAYSSETDAEHRSELKKVYMGELEELTTKSKEYQNIIKKFVSALAQANQEAINIANSEMRKIYIENYNQVADECRKAGIKVGEEEE